MLDRKNADLVALFDVDIEGDLLPEPSWNLAPTQRIAVVIDSLPRATSENDFPEPIRRLEAARWGLVPSWAEDVQEPPLFNARSEDVASRRSFQASVERRRAVIPATGYYEWRTVDGVKSPQFVSLPGEELLLFAGLYDWWRNPAAPEGSAERWLLSTTILTRPATGVVAAIHERMPVLLDGDLVEEWLDPQSDGSQELVDEVAGAAESVASRAVFHEVSPLVGSVQNDGPHLVDPLP